jgi:hypothetical protein
MKTYRAQLPTAAKLAQPSFVQMFYDKRARVWTITVLDGHDNQIGDADYALGCHGLKEATAHAELTHGKLRFEAMP